MQTDPDRTRWYAGVTGYQWLVLAIASAGWVFDVYESQIFNITRSQLLADILGGQSSDVEKYGDIFLGIFLLGGTVGGLAAGSLADRFGRRPVMIATILMYSLFSGLTYLVTDLWQVGALRFLVAIGIGGEWAVAASLVAEVFPARARAQASGIFHASSILGTWLAALAGLAVGANWRVAYLLGILPALLILWVRASVREPESWQARKRQAEQANQANQLGSFRILLTTFPWAGRAWCGMALAAVGLGTFWAVTVAGQDLARQLLMNATAETSASSESGDPLAESGQALDRVSPVAQPTNERGVIEEEQRRKEEASQWAKFAYGIVQASGGGLGLLAFGPLAARWGRRKTFIAYQLGALCIVPITCFAPQNFAQLICLLPVFGFLTLGMHAGFAIYFPELFPTHLRATGTSFCFNGGRVVAVPVLLSSGWLKAESGLDLGWAITLLSSLFVVGIVLVLFLPETKGQELPE